VPGASLFKAWQRKMGHKRWEMQPVKFPVNSSIAGGCHERQKPHAPTPQAPIRNRQREKSQTPKVLTAILI